MGIVMLKLHKMCPYFIVAIYLLVNLIQSKHFLIKTETGDEKTSHEKLASEAGDDYAEDSSLYDYSQNYYSVSPSKELKNHENKNFTIAKGKKLKDFIKEE